MDDDVNKEFESNMQTKKIKEELLEAFRMYNTKMTYMIADAPLAVLCLPKKVLSALLAHGCSRVYDVLNLDLAEIETLSESDIRNFTTRLDQFIAMF